MRTYCGAAAACLAAAAAVATETENLNFSFLPAGRVVVDGKADDWDLSAGVFACGDAENAREKFAVWIHGMYDAEKLYLLARWVDPTPMNNPGSVKGDYGFRGDCLQFRIVTAPDVTGPGVSAMNRSRTEKDPEGVRVSHWDCWSDRDGLDALGGSYGVAFKEGGPGGVKEGGGAQAFLRNADGSGYAQELAIPWKFLTKEGVAPKTGDKLVFTVEPNFTVGQGGRLTIKDIFKPGVAIDRVFTFSGPSAWGYATLEAKGNLPPRPVRLADGREFPVKLENGVPVVDWTGLIKSREPQGFKAVRFALPEDGYVSLNLFDADGAVVRQLLAAAFYTKGEHEVEWDGLTTMSVRKPGELVKPGAYTWRGLWHKGIGLKLRGWACAVGGPWDGMGGDHGDPVSVAADGEKVYLGWAGGEGGRPLVAMAPDGTPRWSNIRGGIAGANLVASDGKTVYVFNPYGQYSSVAVYRLGARDGGYTEWSAKKNTDYLLKDLWAAAGGPETNNVPHPSALAAGGGRVFVAFGGLDAVLVLDAATGNVVKTLGVENPGAMHTADGTTLHVLSRARDLLAVDVEAGAVRRGVTVELKGKEWAWGLAVDKAGRFYVGIRDGAEQVYVYSAEGRLETKIGKAGGRVKAGPWEPERLGPVGGLAMDGKGQLWVAETDGTPKRFSVWNPETGELVREVFGPSSYGAIGGCVNPADPDVMVGQGCEWRLDPATGKARCTGVITREGMGASRFGFGPDGKRLYLAVTPGFLHGEYPVRIFERLGEGQYALRSVLSPHKWQKEGEKGKSLGLRAWADENGDGQEQDAEVKTFDVALGGWIQGWYLSMAPDLAFYGGNYPIRVTGWTKCGAPRYDLTGVAPITEAANIRYRGGMGAQKGHGSTDGRFMLFNGSYGDDHSTVDCYEIGTGPSRGSGQGRKRWAYPSNFTGVHGSHRACGPEVGMIRGAYDIVGTAKLPAPAGNVWVIPTNKGEWHMLTEDGYYLSRLFQGDPMRVAWPEKAVPGAILDECPPGAGEEAFGGSISQGPDPSAGSGQGGKVYVQAGHTAFWNLEVTGLETVQALPSKGSVELTEADVKTAQQWRERYLQDETGKKLLAVKRKTVAFTGDLRKDFEGAAQAGYAKADATAVRTALAWDDQKLYAGWEVRDDTPWKNGTDAPEFLYARGDTVDLQLGTDPKAAKDRKDGAAGDVRLSIGPFQGQPIVMAYRKVAKDKKPKTFSSGVVKAYEMDSVAPVVAAEVKVTVDEVNKRYVVEAAIPWAELGGAPATGTTWSGDFGVTHGDKAKADTVLRTYWNNQSTGLVSDEVFELQMSPANWGELKFE
jgi:sugar lactone lactonase YvrE